MEGEEHPADMLTTYVDGVHIWKHCESMSLGSEEGRSEAMPAVGYLLKRKTALARRYLLRASGASTADASMRAGYANAPTRPG